MKRRKFKRGERRDEKKRERKLVFENQKKHLEKKIDQNRDLEFELSLLSFFFLVLNDLKMSGEEKG